MNLAAELEAKFNAHFVKLGTRIKIGVLNRSHSLVGRPEPPYRIDVMKDTHGEFFDIRATHPAQLGLEVLEIDPKLRHLLLLVRQGKAKEKFLCGHDERHFFVAGVPQKATTIRRAMEMLQPPEVQARAKGERPKKRLARKSKAFLRQGEWFFIPAPDMAFATNTILKNEPIRRGRSKPHQCEELVRFGGTQVYVSSAYPNGITRQEFEQIPLKEQKRFGWRTMVRGANVYVRGWVRHPDHKTVMLKGWHRVSLNAEIMSEQVAFLD